MAAKRGGLPTKNRLRAKQERFAIEKIKGQMKWPGKSQAAAVARSARLPGRSATGAAASRSSGT
jgi:hypothetical protein